MTLSVIWTPPPLIATPRRARCTRPSKPPVAEVSIVTTTRPFPLDVSETVPRRAAVKEPLRGKEAQVARGKCPYTGPHRRPG